MARNYEKNELLSVEECCAPRQVNNTIQNNQTKNDATRDPLLGITMLLSAIDSTQLLKSIKCV